MRDILCLLLCLSLIFSLVYAASVPRALPLPAGRSAAWWGLLFPGLFYPAQPGERVTFAWPLLDRLVRALTANG